MGSELAVSDKQGAGVLMRQATDVAGVCAAIVKSTAKSIQGRKYVQVEGWQSIAVAYGCVASARAVERVQGGFRAVGEVRRMSDGVVVASGEGFVGDDEKGWAARPEFARRAMAQTRAISRACRSAFAFVVVMIDAELGTTPAEEMEALEGEVVSRVAYAPAHAPAPGGQRAAPPVASSSRVTHFPAYGRAKGAPIAGASEKDLDFYAAGARKSLADPAKAKWHDRERALLEAIEAEQRRQAGGAPAESNEPPQTDEDAPF